MTLVETTVPDGLHDQDVLIWSEQQAELLRRLTAGEQMNDAVDWTNVIEELQDVERSQLRSCEGLRRQAMLHLLKLHLACEQVGRALAPGGRHVPG